MPRIVQLGNVRGQLFAVTDDGRAWALTLTDEGLRSLEEDQGTTTLPPSAYYWLLLDVPFVER